MKKIGIFILIVLTAEIVQCQTFSAAFDPWDNNINNGNGWAYESGVNGNIQINQPPILQLYLDKFKVTKNIQYLEKFAIQATRIMERRDDYIGQYDAVNGYNPNVGVFAYYCGQNPNPSYSSPGQIFGSPYQNTLFGYPYNPPSIYCNEYLPDIFNLEADVHHYLGNGRSFTWSDDTYDNANDAVSCNQIYQPSMFEGICEPMAEFCYYLYADPDFAGVANKTVPQEVQNITNEPYTPTYSDWSYPFSFQTPAPQYPLTTFANFADWLYFHIAQVDQYIYGQCWSGPYSIYSPRNSGCESEYGNTIWPTFYGNQGGLAQTNQQCFAADVMLYLYFYEQGILGYSDAPGIVYYSNPHGNSQQLPGGLGCLGRVQDIGKLIYDQLQQNEADAAYGISPSAYAWLNDENNYDNDPCQQSGQGDTEYIVTNDLTQCSAEDALKQSAIRWKIEQFHREEKQLTGIEKCQCRLNRSQRNHILCCTLVWLFLSNVAHQNNVTTYQIKHSLWKEYLTQQLKCPKLVFA